MHSARPVRTNVRANSAYNALGAPGGKPAASVACDLFVLVFDVTALLGAFHRAASAMATSFIGLPIGADEGE